MPLSFCVSRGRETAPAARFRWFSGVLVRMVVRVLVRLLGVERGHGHHQPAVLHAFEADENVGEMLDAGSLAVDNQHFKAGIDGRDARDSWRQPGRGARAALQ